MRALGARTIPFRIASLLLHGGQIGKTLTGSSLDSDTVYLTFDDGPHPAHTDSVLSVLTERKASATFFVVGEAAQRAPALVRRIESEGHGVGLHGHGHVRASCLHGGQVLTDIDSAIETLQGLLGWRPRIYRPPYGDVTVALVRALRSRALRTVLWNQDPKDYGAKSATEAMRRLGRLNLRGGDVVLLHDSFEYAAELTDILVTRSAADGLTLDVLPGSRRDEASRQA